MSHRSLSCHVLFSLMLAGIAAPVLAEEQITRGDVLLIERVHSSESSGVRLPKRGALMTTVESEFGAPLNPALRPWAAAEVRSHPSRAGSIRNSPSISSIRMSLTPSSTA